MEQHQRRWLGKKSLLWPYGWLWLAAWWHDNIILTKKQNTWFLVIIMQDIRRPDRWRMEFKIQGKCWTFLIFFAITFMYMRKIGKSRTIQPTNPFFYFTRIEFNVQNIVIRWSFQREHSKLFTLKKLKIYQRRMCKKNENYSRNSHQNSGRPRLWWIKSQILYFSKEPKKNGAESWKLLAGEKRVGRCST